MSKTDKTRPWFVKVTEHPRGHHDHANGVCEIKGAKPTRENTGGSSASGVCFYEGDWWRPEFRCSCPMCGYDAFGVPRRKLERLAGRREARAYT